MKEVLTSLRKKPFLGNYFRLIANKLFSKSKVTYHVLALLCTGTSGLYFLYGRFRVIISIDSRSSITLKY